MGIRIEYQPSTPLEQVQRIDTECFPHEPLEERVLSDAMQQDFWVAWDGESVVGYAYMLRRPEASWLARIGTSAAQRGRGAGTALMKAVLEHSTRIGLPETILYVKTDNPAAIRLYERFGFRPVEASYHFILRDPIERLKHECAAGTKAVPITEVPEPDLPSFPREWTQIAGMHRPPDAYVFIFTKETKCVGYCRLSPAFPGCFPFVVERPHETLMPALRSVMEYLLPEKPLLKLTVWNSAVAGACRDAGLELNYELIKMHRG